MARHKKRSDGRYESKINLGVNPSGGYIRKTIYGHTIAELEENVRQARNQAEQGVDLIAQKPTVKVWADKWLAVYKPDIKRSMRSVYSSLINKWLFPLHDLKIDKVRQVQIQEILQSASQELSQSSIDKLYNCLRGIFSSARQNGLTISDISEKLAKPTGGAKRKRDALTTEEKEIMVTVCKNAHDGLLPMLIMFAGLRIGEALALTYDDIKDGYISVNKTIVHEENSNKPSVKQSPKTDAGFRRVPILPPLEPYLRKPVAELPSAHIFSRNGNLYSNTMRRNAWRTLMGAYKEAWEEKYSGDDIRIVPREITSHMLRHTYITMLYDAGVDVKTAQKWAGHATVGILMDVYTHLSDSKESEAADKLKRFVTHTKSDDNFDDTDDNLMTKRIVKNSTK